MGKSRFFARSQNRLKAPLHSSYDERRRFAYDHLTPEHRKIVDENRRRYVESAGPMLAELAQAGLPVESIGELYQRPMPYKHAIPILLKWLPRIHQIRVKEDIVRALSIRSCRPAAASAIIGEYRSTPEDASLKWAMGNALSVVADDSVYDDIVEIVRNRANGRSREMVAVALGNMKNPGAVDVLIGLLDDDIVGHALLALRKLGAVQARPFVEPFLTHPRTWWRNEAKKTIAKFDKLEEKERLRRDSG